MLWFRRYLAGPIRDRWNAFQFIPDAAQIRAIDILDQLAESKLINHRSSTTHVSSPQFDLSLFRGDEKTTDGAHEQVAEYTKKIADQNKQLLEAQRKKRMMGGEMKKINVVSAAPVTAKLYSDRVNGSSSKLVTQPPSALPISQVPSIYLFGSVGRGKTIMMNLIHDHLKNFARVERYHFFELMKNVHASLATSRSITEVANSLADNFDVLCIDELAITDIQDATIFPSLMNVLIRRNVALIMTSNQHPQFLYTNGLNRHIYLPPFLSLLRSSGCRLISLNDQQGSGEIDYRRIDDAVDRDRVWLWTRSSKCSQQSLDTSSTDTVTIQLSDTRSLTLSTTATHYYLDVGEIVSDQYSESDYVKIADFFLSTRDGKKILKLFIDSKFGANDIMGSARRFGKMVEIFYDKQIMVEFVSEVDIEELFEHVETKNLLESQILGESVDSIASPLAASSVDEAIRSIERCVSRLSQAKKKS